MIGLGAGSTVAYLADEPATNPALASSIPLVSSTTETSRHMLNLGLQMANVSMLEDIDLYFDGCDQLDKNSMHSKAVAVSIQMKKRWLPWPHSLFYWPMPQNTLTG